MNYPTYSRGQDAPPTIETYMYNPNLKSEAQEDQLTAGRERPKVMSPRRLTYEQKFEKFIVQNLEKYIENRENPEERKPKFDLQMVNNESSVNI